MVSSRRWVRVLVLVYIRLGVAELGAAGVDGWMDGKEGHPQFALFYLRCHEIRGILRRRVVEHIRAGV